MEKDNVKPLASSHRVLTWLCVLPAEENTRKLEQRLYVALLLALIASDVAVAISSFMYILNFKSHSLQDNSIALQELLAAIPVANTIIMAFLFRHKIPPMLGKLLGFYKKCMEIFSFNYLIC